MTDATFTGPDLTTFVELGLEVTGQRLGGALACRVLDPHQWCRGARPDRRVVDTADEALSGADIVMLLTEWPEYVALEPAHARSLVRTPRIIEGRNALELPTCKNGTR